MPAVYLCETGPEGASGRLKWLASTCLAGVVGVCLIGVAIYASLNMGDGSGMVSSFKRASLAALQPMRTATRATAKHPTQKFVDPTAESTTTATA